MPSEFTRRVVVAIPISAKGPAEALGRQMNWGEENYTLRLAAASDPETHTHWGLTTPCTERYEATITSAQRGQFPQGVAAGVAGPVVQVMLVRFDPVSVDWRDQMSAFLAENDLVLME